MSKQETAAREEFCPDCGGAIPGGRASCRAAFDALGARAYQDVAYASVHRLVVDCYAMQHLDPFCVSAKSYAAHLTGLCCGVERGGDPRIHRAVHLWMSGQARFERPPNLPHLGSMTLADVLAAEDSPDHVARVKAWAAHIWAAYKEQHALARHWIDQALDTERNARTRVGT
jgi:hypothetical protein